MQTLDFVSGLHNCQEFSQPLSCLYHWLCKNGKHFLLLQHCTSTLDKQFMKRRLKLIYNGMVNSCDTFRIMLYSTKLTMPKRRLNLTFLL